MSYEKSTTRKHLTCKTCGLKIRCDDKAKHEEGISHRRRAKK